MKPTASFLIGFAIALALVPVLIALYLRFGNAPVAVTDKPFPFEADIVKIPRRARIRRDEPKSCPLPEDDANVISGARIYATDCAGCHGFKRENAMFARDMYPPAPNLWAKHKSGAVGVSDDPVGETYWKVKYGIRLTGMPAFSSLLTETQIWQVSMLLANADKPLPASAEELVSHSESTFQNSTESHISPVDEAAGEKRQ
jgi:thiosulfate dehydrogenase